MRLLTILFWLICFCGFGQNTEKEHGYLLFHNESFFFIQRDSMDIDTFSFNLKKDTLEFMHGLPHTFIKDFVSHTRTIKMKALEKEDRISFKYMGVIPVVIEQKRQSIRSCVKYFFTFSDLNIEVPTKLRHYAEIKSVIYLIDSDVLVFEKYETTLNEELNFKLIEYTPPGIFLSHK